MTFLCLAFILSSQTAAQTTYPPTGFTLPKGKSITITYEVDVNTGACPTGTAPANPLIVNQATVSGTNFSNVLTDTLPAGGAKDPTTTPIGKLTLGNLVYNDMNRNGVFDAGDAGINSVVVNLYTDDGDGVLDAGDGATIASTTTASGGLYSFSVCPGNYIVEVAASNFTSGGALYNSGAPYVSSPIGGAADPDNDVNNDDNGDPVAGFGVASAAITLDYDTEPTTDGDAIDDTNLTLDFGFKTPTTVTIADNSASESGGVLNFTVTRSDNLGDLTLNVSSSPISPTTTGDFTAPGTVTILNGSLTGTLAVMLNNENIVEPAETFTVTLSGAPAGVIITDAEATGTITNDDNATVTLSGPTSLVEGNSGFVSQTTSVILDNPVQGGFMVTVNTEPGTAVFGDFSGPDATFTFTGNANETKTINHNIFGDLTVELDETFTLTLEGLTGAPAGVTLGSALTRTITNDDSATLSFSSSSGVSQPESNTTQTFTVTLTNPVDVNVSVLATTNDQTAISPDDFGAFTGQPVTITAGMTSQNVNVSIVNENKVEANETYTIGLSGVSAMGRSVSIAAPSLVTGTIENDDAAIVTLTGGGSSFEGNFGTSGKTFTATLNNPVQGGFSIAYNTNDGTTNPATAGSDYQDNDATLMFSGTANEMKTFTVNVNGDTGMEADETYTTTLGAISGTTLGASISTAGSPQTYTITNDDQEVSVSVSPSSVLEDGSTNLVYTFTRTGYTADSLSVFFTVGGTATFNTDYTQSGANGYGTVSSYVHFTFNETMKTVMINPSSDMTAEQNETVELTLRLNTTGVRYNIGTPGSATGTIEDDDNSVSVAVSPGTTAEDGSTNLIYTFTRTDVNSGALVVNFSVGGTATLTTDYAASGATTFTASSGTVTFSGVSPTAAVTIDPVVDAIVEDNETVILTVTSGVGYGVGSPSIATGTIDNDDIATLTISGGNSESETSTSRTFTAQLSAAVQGGFKVAYVTNNGTATSTDDYTDNDGQLTFAGNANEMQSLTVTVNNDNKVELDENFTVIIGGTSADISMTSPEQASSFFFTNAMQTETIENDDAAQVNLNPTTVSQNEGAGNQTFTVTLSNPVDVPVTVDFIASNNTALESDNDYEFVTPQPAVTFPPNTTTSQTVAVTVNNDFKVEPDEIFNVTINNLMAQGRNVALGSTTGSGTIVNDDSATLTLTGGGGVNEGNAGTTPRTFTATLDNPVQGGFTLNFSMNNGTASTPEDYVDNDGSIAFAGTANEMQTITVNVNGDGTVEPHETFTVNMNSISNTPFGSSITLAGSPQTGTITNDDSAVVTLTAFDADKNEGNSPPGTTNFKFRATVDNPVQGGFTVHFQNNDGTATLANNDYQDDDGSVNFNGNANEHQDINMQVNHDLVVEPDETFTASITSLTLPPGTPAGSVTFSNAPQTATIRNDDFATLTLSGGTTQNEGNAGTTSYTFTATLSAAVEGGFQVPFTTGGGTATAGSDYVDNDGTFTFSGNSGEMKTWTVDVNGDNLVELTETLQAALGAISGTSPGQAAAITVNGSPQTLTITNDDSAVLAIAANVNQAENLTPQQFTITLSNPVDVPIMVEALTSDLSATNVDMDYAPYFQPFTFPANSTTSQTANVIVNNDNKVEDNENYTFKLQNLMASGRSVTLGTDKTGTIVNDDAATVTLSGGGSANEGNTGTTPRVFTATLNNPVQGGFTVPYTTNDGTANNGSDYVDNDGTLIFAGTAGEPQTITVLVNGDFFVEADENYTVALGNITGAPAGVTTAGSPQTATILNDEVEYGDAPDTYATLLASNGARHTAILGFRLGANMDGDADGQPGPSANGDDTDAEGDDDDGVTLPSPLITNTTANVTVNASATGNLDGWVDFNNNGSFADAGEKVFNNVALVSGNNSLSFAVPAGATPSNTFARFRFSSVGGLSFNGSATDGEVEDYAVQIVNTQFSINDPTVTEGNAGTSNLTFTITRSTNASNNSVDYAITGGTAQTSGTSNTGGNDYQPLASGTASFTAGGALTQTVTVVVNGDQTVELNETVVMTLSNPVNGSILDGEGTGTITNDDAATISVSSPSITEGNGGTSNLTFNITMTTTADANVGFDFATANGSATIADNDFQGTVGSHTLAPGQTSKMVNVPVVGDCKIETDEMFSLFLANLGNNGRNVSFTGGGASTSGTGTILNDDALPGITCPNTFNQNTDPNVCNANVTVPLPSLSSICGSQTLEFRHRPVDNSNNPLGAFSPWISSASNTQNFAKGRWEIEWRVTDGSGNSTCNFYFNVLDNQAPVALCKNITVQLNAAGNVTITPAQVNNGSSDNCSLTLGLSKTTFNCTNVGNNTVILTATDPSNNSHTCTATVTVQDVTAPNALCKPVTVFLNAAGQASVTTAQVNNNSTDACGIQSMSVSPNSFTCTNLGANTVTLTVTDVNNNSATCTTTVTVVDNLPPTVACQNITISLASNGYASITPSQVFNAAGSSDNCGTVNPQSVSQSVFDCSDIGANTVTLTGNDGHGNTATCQATVTVNPFITIVSVTVQDANCNGTGGSITIVATALGGQLRYSIDNFVSFNLTGIFNNLSPGTYPIDVMAAGTSGCSLDGGTVTVGTSGSPQTWYKDIDGDDYSDGVSQVSCTQPANYYLAGSLIATTGDCDDNDVLEFPGQTWYKDQDNDGYSNGTTLIQCLKPVNYKALSQLNAPPTGSNIDCNDNNANIKPGATELCNSIDDDCDGQVDEGVAGGGTYMGNVTLNSQTGAWSSGTGGVNNFPSCYSVIQGNLTIQNSTVNSLAALANLVKVTGSVTIKLTSVVNMNGLHNLDTIGGGLTINNNNYGSKLQSLDGLEDVDWVGGIVKVYYNFTLTDCCAIEDLVGPEPNGSGGAPSIYSNAAGCNNTSQIIACPGFAGGGGNNNLIVTPDQPCPDCPSTASGENWQVMAFPNPANVELKVEIEGDFKGGTVSLTDLAGRGLLRKEVLEGDTQVTLPLDEIGGGLYFLQVRSGEGEVQVIRVVVAK